MKLVVKKNDDKDSRQGVGINKPTDHFKAATYVVNEVIEGKSVIGNASIGEL